MTRFIIRRLLQIVPVLILASIGIWGIIYLLPGNPAAALAGENATPEQVADVAARLGTDKPVIEQYGIWVRHVLAGNLGISFQSNVSVTSLIAGRIPATIELALCSMVIGLVIAAIVGAASALGPRSIIGRVAIAYQNIMLAIPTFWLGILLMILLAFHWHLFAVGAAFVSIWDDPVQGSRVVALPALTLGLHVSCIVSRFVRTSLEENMQAGYVRTARSKGAPERTVVVRHAARNALLPVVTITGLQLASFLGGAVVVESLFNYPGIGALVLNAVHARDYVLLQGSLLFVVTVFLLLNLLIDLLYAYIDPRVKLAAAAA